MINEDTIQFTGKTREIEGEIYYEFIQTLPAPDWFRYYYFSQVKNPAESKKHFTELKYQPQIINQLIIEKMKKEITSKLEVSN